MEEEVWVRAELVKRHPGGGVTAQVIGLGGDQVTVDDADVIELTTERIGPDYGPRYVWSKYGPSDKPLRRVVSAWEDDE